ncbi:uncharacterized protein MONBRDRAFT_23016 [Monosiga brevicollis MX1]|uniref:Uncharacterized protein n=1 Tax=Monosiga brevicollis TaxID=81824 RepID=A9USR9_MONBE|nr:uncharacterized protein MONBRDRAFT_23016 [Monosiga brevicollis MX1]EDQ92152.1 predicted protein [Monosiga brevicollis MX1]|eukprot:XP_001743438.1 hypothetical protein [Monosiga brevicollis MX1]
MAARPASLLRLRGQHREQDQPAAKLPRIEIPPTGPKLLFADHLSAQLAVVGFQCPVAVCEIRLIPLNVTVPKMTISGRTVPSVNVLTLQHSEFGVDGQVKPFMRTLGTLTFSDAVVAHPVDIPATDRIILSGNFEEITLIILGAPDGRALERLRCHEEEQRLLKQEPRRQSSEPAVVPTTLAPSSAMPKSQPSPSESLPKRTSPVQSVVLHSNNAVQHDGHMDEPMDETMNESMDEPKPTDETVKKSTDGPPKRHDEPLKNETEAESESENKAEPTAKEDDRGDDDGNERVDGDALMDEPRSGSIDKASPAEQPKPDHHRSKEEHSSIQLENKVAAENLGHSHMDSDVDAVSDDDDDVARGDNNEPPGAMPRDSSGHENATDNRASDSIITNTARVRPQVVCPGHVLYLYTATAASKHRAAICR